jgi:hypothetical protein
MSERELTSRTRATSTISAATNGSFAESDDQPKSLSQDVKQHAKTKKPKNEGDKGTERRRDIERPGRVRAPRPRDDRRRGVRGARGLGLGSEEIQAALRNLCSSRANSKQS